MNNDKLLEENVIILKTPLVDISIVDENGDNINFDIIESSNDLHSVYIDNDENKIIEAENYAEKIIRIKTASLEIGKKYFVKTSKPIESRVSDEHLFTYGYTKETQTFAISFPDPNDDLKMFPEFYDENTKMMWYDFNGEECKGTEAVSFYLIDRKKEFIYIPTAWIWNIQDHIIDYERAAEVFTWII